MTSIESASSPKSTKQKGVFIFLCMLKPSVKLNFLPYLESAFFDSGVSPFRIQEMEEVVEEIIDTAEVRKLNSLCMYVTVSAYCIHCVKPINFYAFVQDIHHKI